MLKNEVSLLEEARTEGRAEGLDVGTLIGKIQLLQELLRRPISDQATLVAIPPTDLHSLLHHLQHDLKLP